MQTVVIVIHLMIVAVLIATVLLQKSEGGGLGMGGGAGFMSSRGTANLLTRTTAVLAAGFFLTSLSAVLDCELRPQAGVDHRRPTGLAIAAGGCARPRSRRRLSGGVLDPLKKADEQQRSAGAVGSAGAAFAIKQGGHAGWWLAILHQRSPSRALIIASNFDVTHSRGRMFAAADDSFWQNRGRWP